MIDFATVFTGQADGNTYSREKREGKVSTQVNIQKVSIKRK